MEVMEESHGVTIRLYKQPTRLRNLLHLTFTHNTTLPTYYPSNLFSDSSTLFCCSMVCCEL